MERVALSKRCREPSRMRAGGAAAHRLLGLAALLSLPPAAAVSTLCPLPWNANASMPNGINLEAVCPYGTRLKGFDVTIPPNMKMVSVEFFCVLWGIIPFLVIGVSVLDMLISAVRLRGLGTRETCFLGFVGFMTGCNELVFKRWAMEPRPDHSCNFSCGFPSGHSVMSCGFFMLMFLDAVFRTMPRVPLTLADARDQEKATAGRTTFFGWTIREIFVSNIRAGLTFMPLSRAHTLNQTDFCFFALAWGVVLLPVPFSRTVLNDHTPKQVMLGSLIGLTEAVMYFGLMRIMQQNYNHLLGQRVFGAFVHNFPLPVYEAISKTCKVLAKAEEPPHGSATSPKVPLSLQMQRLHGELEWYIKQLEPTCTWASFDEDGIVAAREMGRLQGLQDDIERRLEVEGLGLAKLADDSASSD